MRKNANVVNRSTATMINESRIDMYVHYFIMHCLHNHFASKADMSRKLNIGYRTILDVTTKPGRRKGASLVLHELIEYCVRNNISMDAIAHEFHAESTNEDHCLREVYVPDCGIIRQWLQHRFSGISDEQLLAAADRAIKAIQQAICSKCSQYWHGSPWCPLLSSKT